MTDRPDSQDKLLDRNLKMIGERLPIPGEPNVFQQAKWKRPPRSAYGASPPGRSGLIQKGVRFVKTHRTLTAAGSAVAATIVIGTLLLFPAMHREVEAAVIFGSLREALTDGLEITLENIGAEGAKVNGRIVLVQPSGQNEESAEGELAGGCYIEIRAVGDGSSGDLAGLDVDVTISITPEQQWLYAKFRGLPAEIAQEEPILAGLLGAMAQDGLLLNLDGILKQDEIDEIVQAMSGAMNEAMDEIREASQEIAVGEGGSKGDVSAEEAELLRIASGLLSGQAAGEDIDSLVSLLESHASGVSVRQVQEGVYVLSAEGFDFSEEDKETTEMLGDLAMTITYREGVGVSAADLNHIGEYDGSIRLRTTGITLDSELFSKDRYLNDGVTRVFDLAGLMQMAESMGGNITEVQATGTD